ncbi:hypothetical protein DYI23_07475 [Roseibium polysiphoniae]|uniref:Uncharacterized protein n=1 Tax=Roseibium polysiphoniae TaxID=2571221 RepID=A0A944CBN2_9HYPH|nr:hypothetical protein [Roseibium polysiphoniae]
MLYQLSYTGLRCAVGARTTPLFPIFQMWASENIAFAAFPPRVCPEDVEKWRVRALKMRLPSREVIG